MHRKPPLPSPRPPAAEAASDSVSDAEADSVQSVVTPAPAPTPHANPDALAAVVRANRIPALDTEAYACPLDAVGIRRPPDKCASEGGGFDARRGRSRKHEALDINSKEGVDVLAVRTGLVVVAHRKWGRNGWNRAA